MKVCGEMSKGLTSYGCIDLDCMDSFRLCEACFNFYKRNMDGTDQGLPEERLKKVLVKNSSLSSQLVLAQDFRGKFQLQVWKDNRFKIVPIDSSFIMENTYQNIQPIIIKKYKQIYSVVPLDDKYVFLVGGASGIPHFKGPFPPSKPTHILFMLDLNLKRVLFALRSDQFEGTHLTLPHTAVKVSKKKDWLYYRKHVFLLYMVGGIGGTENWSTQCVAYDLDQQDFIALNDLPESLFGPSLSQPFIHPENDSTIFFVSGVYQGQQHLYLFNAALNEWKRINFQQDGLAFGFQFLIAHPIPDSNIAFVFMGGGLSQDYSTKGYCVRMLQIDFSNEPVVQQTKIFNILSKSSQIILIYNICIKLQSTGDYFAGNQYFETSNEKDGQPILITHYTIMGSVGIYKLSFALSQDQCEVSMIQIGEKGFINIDIGEKAPDIRPHLRCPRK